MRGRRHGDEELGAVGARAGIRHGQQERTVELQLRVELVLELVARAATTGAGRVAALDHELVNDAVENGAIVERAGLLALCVLGSVVLLALSQANEVLHGYRCVVTEQVDNNVTVVGVHRCSCGLLSHACHCMEISPSASFRRNAVSDLRRVTSMIHALLFDLDDTLMDHTAAMHAAVEDWLPGGHQERFAEIEKKWFAAYERGEVSHQGQRVERCREFLGRPEMTEQEALAEYSKYLAAYEKHWCAVDGAREALEYVLDLGLNVGILTNGARDMQESKLRAGGLDLPGIELFPTVEMGHPKPHPEAYLEACRRMSVEPRSTLMVGDSIANDVEGARAAGLKALHFDRDKNGDIAALSELTAMNFEEV